MENLNEEKIVEEVVVEETKKSKEKFWGLEENFFGTLLSVSRLSVFGIGPFGFLLPLAMWGTNKNKSTFINKIGKNVVNWMISFAIYFIVLVVITGIGAQSQIKPLAQIGLVLLGGLSIVDIYFAVKGAIEANKGNAWNYPGAIKFIK